MPRQFQDFYDYVDPTVFQAEGTRWVRLFGFGFANSRWLTCEFDGVAFPAKFVGVDELHCDIDQTAVRWWSPIGDGWIYPLG
eukprot:159323-Prorocentrum_minimum.AAC.1